MDTTNKQREAEVSHDPFHRDCPILIQLSYAVPVAYVTFLDMVTTLNETVNRYTSMAALCLNLTRLVEEEGGALSEKEVDEVRIDC